VSGMSQDDYRHSVMDGQHFRIQGRGTRVLVVEGGRLQIIHEHLSRYPNKL
jgi:hypothetical protein